MNRSAIGGDGHLARARVEADPGPLRRRSASPSGASKRVERLGDPVEQLAAAAASGRAR